MSTNIEAPSDANPEVTEIQTSLDAGNATQDIAALTEKSEGAVESQGTPEDANAKEAEDILASTNSQTMPVIKEGENVASETMPAEIARIISATTSVEDEPMLNVELNLVRCPRSPVYKTSVPLTASLRDLFNELHQAWPFGSSVPQVDVTHLTIVHSGKRYTVTSSEPEDLDRPFGESMVTKLLIKKNLPMRGVAFIYEPTEAELARMRAREAGDPSREMCGGVCTVA